MLPCLLLFVNGPISVQRPLANRRKDAKLMMMYKIDRELVSITKENK
jgi:hypothetical protein